MNYECIWGKRVSGRENSRQARVDRNQRIRENRGEDGRENRGEDGREIRGSEKLASYKRF